MPQRKIDLKDLHRQISDGVKTATDAKEKAERILRERPGDETATKILKRATRATKGLQSAMFALEACCCDVPAFNCDFDL